MRTIATRSLAFAAAATLTLALTACGGDDKKDDSSDNAADPTVTAEETSIATEATDAATDEATDATAEPGDTQEGVADPKDEKACQVLSSEEITEVTGVDFSAVTPVVDSSGSCTWDLTSTGGLAMAAVTYDDSTVGAFEVTKTGVAEMFDDVTDVDVPGADRAFSYMAGWAVVMEVDGKFVQVVWMNLDPVTGTDTTVGLKLAEKVAGNL